MTKTNAESQNEGQGGSKVGDLMMDNKIQAIRQMRIENAVVQALTTRQTRYHRQSTCRSGMNDEATDMEDVIKAS